MRLRIIAFGVAVLVILAGVSIAAFLGVAALSGPGHAVMNDSFARSLVVADARSRQRLFDEALARQVEISMYGPEDALLATNVDPPLPIEPEVLPPPPVLDDPGRPPGSSQLAQAMFQFSGVMVVMRPAPSTSPIATFAIALVVTLLGLVLLSFPVAAAMTRKLDALAEVAHRFGEGDFSQRADTAGPPEVRQTAQAFNAMAERIGAQRLGERELLANVSHELRTPMARMAVLLELLDGKPTEASRYVGELARDLRELETLLERIMETFRLDLASPRARESWLKQRVSLDLRDLIAEVAKDFCAREPSFALVVTLAPTPVVREVDRTMVRLAVMNLLDNARKYSRPGSEIRLSVETRGEILVEDRGQGVDPVDLPYLFEPFFRAARTRTPSAAGVGLGLAFVKMVAALHQGDVSVQSQPGVGSTFRLTFAVRSSTP